MIYSVADLHHLRLSRQADYENRPDLLIKAQQLRDQELLAAIQADAVITHSSAEANLLQQTLPAAKVHTVVWPARCRPRLVRFTDRRGMAFIGNFDYAPNVAAALQLRDEIMPMVRAVNPALTCRLVGDHVPNVLKAQPGPEVVGRIADLDHLFNTVRLTVAPLPYGAGLKAKVIESLAAGVPCICSPIAVEGFDLPSSLQELVADDSAAAARVILRLHGDPEAHQKLAKRVLAFAAERFSEQVVDAAMAGAVG